MVELGPKPSESSNPHEGEGLSQAHWEKLLQTTITRRNVLKGIFLAGVGWLAAACSDVEPILSPTFTPRASPTLTSTREPTPMPTQTQTPESTPTPKPPEVISTYVPDLYVERHYVKFDEITNSIPQSFLQDLRNKSLTQKYNLWAPFHLNGHSGQSFIGHGEVRLNRGKESIYYNGESDRFFKLPSESPTKEDLTVLNWEKGAGGYDGELSSRGGKILYEYYDFPRRQDGHAYILVDTVDSTKTVIKNLKTNLENAYDLDFQVRMSSGGNKLAISFFDDPHRSTYLIDLNDWRSQQINLDNHTKKWHQGISGGQYEAQNMDMLINEDGSLLYSAYNELKYGYQAYGQHIDTKTGQRSRFAWPFEGLVHTPRVASPNFEFIAETLGIIESYNSGIVSVATVIRTPDGFFKISSPRNSPEIFAPKVLENDGTFHTFLGRVFKFENGNYVPVERGNLPGEINITKVKV